MKFLLFTFIIVVSFTSCKKKGKANFTIKGVITDSSFSNGLDGATVKLYEKPAGSSSMNLLGTTTSNSFGEYSFTFPRNQVESYQFTCTKTNYFPIDATINFSDLTIENDNVINYSTYAKSWAKLHFINQSGVSSVRFTKTVGKSGCTECCSSSEQILSGFTDTSVYCINNGNTTYTYSYYVPGTTNLGNKTTTTIPFDSTEILLTL